jgi:hypothetical protein
VAQGISYQAVVRNAEGTPITESNVSFRFSYSPVDDSTDTHYVEVFETRTNQFGLVNLVLTEGEPQDGTADNLDFTSFRYSLSTEIDTDGGNDFQKLGRSILRDVPYALSSPRTSAGLFSSCATTDGLTVCGWMLTEGGILLTGNRSEGYNVSTSSSSPIFKLVVEGNSSTSDGLGDFKLGIHNPSDSTIMYYQMQMYDLSNHQVIDNHLTGNIFKQEFISGTLNIIIPNIGGGYPNGFRLIMN